MTEWTDPVEEEERKAMKFEKVRSDVSLESISHKRSVSQKVLKPMSRMPIHRTMLQQIDEDDEQEDGRGGLFKSMILGNTQ